MVKEEELKEEKQASKRINSVKQFTVLATKVEVHQNGLQIGWGTIATRANGDRYVGEFYDFAGNTLPDTWYDIVLTDETWLEIVPREVM